MELKPTLRIRVIDLVTYITLFALAVIPRLSQLDHFLMVDENLWYERSIAFTKGLVQGQWSQTAQTGHPGVTTMWAGAIGLALSYLQTGMSDRPFQDFVNQMATQTATLERLRWLRLPLAILSGLIIVVAYSLVRHLVDTWPAILGAVLMALEPLFLAHSRVLHHDSPAAIFSLLGILGWLLYMKSRPFVVHPACRLWNCVGDPKQSILGLFAATCRSHHTYKNLEGTEKLFPGAQESCHILGIAIVDNFNHSGS
jgi:dolichyl-phosphate-mannose--protein O-mannosyl transferase